jgi:hypothetical protein
MSSRVSGGTASGGVKGGGVGVGLGVGVWKAMAGARVGVALRGDESLPAAQAAKRISAGARKTSLGMDHRVSVHCILLAARRGQPLPGESSGPTTHLKRAGT